MSCIEISEKYGLTGTKNIYFKPEDQNKFVRLSACHDKIHDYNKINSNFLNNFCRKVFLPQGYPKTVSEDYFHYQFYDSIQAFASRITGTIATKSVLKSVGVGNAEITPVSAAITWIFKDGTGMFGGILFAWWKGTEFDSNCKRWRLFADILNDAAMTVELLLPYFITFGNNSAVLVLLLLCITTCMKAAVGVAGSATRAAVTQHQAIAGNAADVAAKDGSQETAVNLVASVVGIALLTLLHDSRYEWTVFILFTFLHITANYFAVSSLVFRTLNAFRFNIILRSYCRFDIVPEPSAANRSENVIIGMKNFNSDYNLFGFKIKIGTSLEDIILKLYKWDELKIIFDIYKNKSYVIIPNNHIRQINVLLRPGETTSDIIKAYFHAVILALSYHIVNDQDIEFLKKKTSKNNCLLTRLRGKLKKNEGSDILLLLNIVNEFVDDESQIFTNELEEKGWETNLHSIYIDDWRLNDFKF